MKTIIEKQILEWKEELKTHKELKAVKDANPKS